jgi:hypothetical protein
MQYSQINCNLTDKLVVDIMMDYEFIKLDEDEFELCNPDVKEFEQVMRQNYSLGPLQFKIDHGENYFAFFQSLGKIEYFLIRTLPEEIIVGTFCAVLRHYPIKIKSNNEIIRMKVPFWYFCDLKVHKDHRKQNLSLKLFETIFEEYGEWAERGYMISMSPGDKQIMNLMSKFDLLRDPFGTNPSEYFTLKIYSLTKDKMFKAEAILKKFFNKISYATNSGKKDLIMVNDEQNDSADKRLNLYHLQHGQFGTKGHCLGILEPHAVIMFCVPEDTNICKELTKNGINTDITASVIYWNIQHFDWLNILTSEI